MEGNLSGFTDAELLRQIRAGDAAALDALLSRHYQTVYSFAYKMSGNAADAADICQEALLKAARAMNNFKGQSKFTTWLYRITVNTSTDWFKRCQRQQQLRDKYAKEMNGEQPDQGSELNREILESLSKLSVKERQAVVLTVYDELTHAEAAEALGCAESTISWRMLTAKKKLRRHFERLGAL